MENKKMITQVEKRNKACFDYVETTPVFALFRTKNVQTESRNQVCLGYVEVRPIFALFAAKINGLYAWLAGGLSLTVLLLAIVGATACSTGDDRPAGQENNGGKDDNGKNDPLPGVCVPSAEGITDLVLLYHTHPSRPLWTAEQIEPYVYRTGADGKPEWLFDGFLFLDYQMEKNGVTYCLDGSRTEMPPADKNLWKGFAEATFADGRGPDALERVLSARAEKGETPPYKRQVVFCLPDPVPGFRNWGILGDKRMDFSDPADRLAAVCWYMDLILEIWQAREYRYLDFGGFYWTKENVTAGSGDSAFLQEVGAWVRAKGYSFSWIPYYGAEGAADWKSHGFDVAYQQPNHFFSTETPDWFLPESIRYAVTHGLKMEMEFDERVKQPEFAERYYKYIDAFEQAAVWRDMPVAYYHGNDGWGMLARATAPELRAMYDRLAGLLVSRQGRFSKIIENKR